MFQDVTSLAFGVECFERSGASTLDVLIPRNSPYGTKKTNRYNTVANNQDRLRIDILQGKENRDDKSLCTSLGHLWVRGLNKGPKGTEGAFVTFEIDTDGLLTVSAEDCRGGEVNQLTVDNIANFTADRLAQLHEQH